MILKYTIKELRTYRKMNLIIFIQTAATFFICFLCISTVTSELRYFIKFNHYFKQEGYYVSSWSTTTPDHTYLIKDSEELESQLKSAYVLGYSQVDTIGCEKEDSVYRVSAMAYDDAIINNFTPKLSKGVWINKANKSSDELEAVISVNPYGFMEGDTVTMDIIVYDGSLTGEIVKVPVNITGVLEDGAEVFGSSVSGADDNDYRNCYQRFYGESMEYPVLLFSKNDLKSLIKAKSDGTIAMNLSGSYIITYDSGIGDAEREFNLSYIKNFSDIVLMEPLDIMHHNNYKYFYNKILQLMPILIGLAIFTLLSQISIRAITVKLQLKNYTIFNICGLSKKKCGYVNFMGTAILSMAAFFVNLGIVFSLKSLPLFDSILIDIGFWQIAACMLIITINLGLSSILPEAIIRKSTPKEILRTN